MPANRRRQAQADPEPETAEQNGAEDYTPYLTKDLTATMVDYATWMDENLPGWDKAEVDRILALGSIMYPRFQKSDFNIQRREERKQERAAASEPEPEQPAQPARSGRSRGAAKPTGKPATGKPASTGRRGRTTARAGAGASPEAPF